MTEDDEGVRRGKQLNQVAGTLRWEHEVDANLMWRHFGISRTAGYIAILRAAGWNIRTTRQRGQMAVYHLDSDPASWAVTTPKPARRVSKTGPWVCSTCGTPATGLLERLTYSMARGSCVKCGKLRMFGPQ